MKRCNLLMSLGLSLTLTACGTPMAVSTVGENAPNLETVETVVETTIEVVEEVETEPDPVVDEHTLSMVVVGDNLIHSPIYNKARQEDGSYDFTPMYEHVKDTIQSYDLAVINQETIFVEDASNVSSYPCFGTPTDMGSAIIDTGFDIVLSATNHTWDKGATGWKNTLKYWREHPEVTLLGIHDSDEDFNSIDIIEENGISLALFNYTYGLNGFTLPEDKQYAVDLLDNKEKFIEDVKFIEDDVDFTVCFLHIGNEYVYEPTEYQVNYINELIDAGADVIVCAHPHVVEPFKTVFTDNGNSAAVFYSCGNFISNQNEVPRVLGGMAEINFTKSIQDGIELGKDISSTNFIPIVTHYNSSEHTVYLLEDYTDELAKTHSLASKGLSVEKLWNLWKEITGE